MLHKINKITLFKKRPRTLYLHIGLHKTGTTSLQKSLSIDRRYLQFFYGVQFFQKKYAGTWVIAGGPGPPPLSERPFRDPGYGPEIQNLKILEFISMRIQECHDTLFTFSQFGPPEPWNLGSEGLPELPFHGNRLPNPAQCKKSIGPFRLAF